MYVYIYIHNVKQHTQSAVRILKTHNSLKRQLCVNLATSVLLGKDRHRVIRARDHHLCRLPPKCESMQIHANPLNASEYICLSTTNWCKMDETVTRCHKKQWQTAAQFAFGFGSMVCCTLCLTKSKQCGTVELWSNVSPFCSFSNCT